MYKKYNVYNTIYIYIYIYIVSSTKRAFPKWGGEASFPWPPGGSCYLSWNFPPRDGNGGLLKPPGTITPWCSRGYGGDLSGAAMIPRDASFSNGYVVYIYIYMPVEVPVGYSSLLEWLLPPGTCLGSLPELHFVFLSNLKDYHRIGNFILFIVNPKLISVCFIIRSRLWVWSHTNVSFNLRKESSYGSAGPDRASFDEWGGGEGKLWRGVRGHFFKRELPTLIAFLIVSNVQLQFLA